VASKLNTEFNYRYQIEGNTPWAKIKNLKDFLEGRIRAAALKPASELKYKAKVMEIEHLKQSNALPHVILNAEAELIEVQSWRATEQEAFDLNDQEINILEKLLAEHYELVEHTRATHSDGRPYSDEEMYELNAANEFTVMIGREIYAEMVANGSPSPAKVRNAMSNPYTLNALKNAGLLPDQMQFIEGNADPLKIEINQTFFPKELPSPRILIEAEKGQGSGLELAKQHTSNLSLEK
jgi:hypothetical protein